MSARLEAHLWRGSGGYALSVRVVVGTSVRWRSPVAIPLTATTVEDAKREADDAIQRVSEPLRIPANRCFLTVVG